MAVPPNKKSFKLFNYRITTIVYIALVLLLLKLYSSRSSTGDLQAHPILEENYFKKAAERAAYLNSISEAQTTAFSKSTLHDAKLVALLSPAYPCPFSLEKSPGVSEVFDGGKWTCGMEEIRSRAGLACIVYSFGSNNNDHFERALSKTAPNCQFFIFDPTSRPVSLGTFLPIGLAAEDGSFVFKNNTYPSKKLTTIMKDLKHSHIDVLKIDVEGSEWEVLETVDWNALCIGQMLVEVHDFSRTRAFVGINALFTRLEAAGFRLYSIEPVSAGSNGQFEIAFLNMHWHPVHGFNKNCKA